VSFDACIYGLAVQEKGLPFDAPEGTAQVMNKQRERVPSMDEYPYLVETAIELEKGATARRGPRARAARAWRPA
jgi:hypothetical protein